MQNKTDESLANLKKTVKNSATQRLLRYGGIKTGVPPKFTYLTVVKALIRAADSSGFCSEKQIEIPYLSKLLSFIYPQENTLVHTQEAPCSTNTKKLQSEQTGGQHVQLRIVLDSRQSRETKPDTSNTSPAF